MTVAELMALYLDGLDADGDRSEKTRYDYRNYTNFYVLPHLGKRKVREVTPEVVLAWQRKLAKSGSRRTDSKTGEVTGGKPLKPNTVRLARAPLSGAFKLAVDLGVIGSNPVAATPRVKAHKSIPKHWSPEEARHFLAMMEGDHLYPTWAFLLSAGLRIGEVVWLRWSNVDLERRRVHVVEFATTLGRELRPSNGKSKDAVRTIDLDDALVSILRGLRKHQKAERLAASDYVVTDYVVTKPEGGSYHPQDLSRKLASDAMSAGLPRLTAHGLRHTCATLMLDNGVPPKVAAERLGHSDATLFMNLYSHVTETMQRDAADKLGAALFG
jgi:integrase